MIQAQGVEYLLSEVVRSPLRPMVAMFIQHLASVRSCLYTQHLIGKPGGESGVGDPDDGANLGTLPLRRSHAAPTSRRGLKHETESCSFALGIGVRIRPRDSFARLAATSWRAGRRAALD